MLPYIWKDGDILFRKDSNFYSRVDEKMKGNWRVIFFATILINIINMIVMNNNEQKRNFGIMKAYGFTDGYIIRRNVYRISILSVIGLSLAAALDQLFTSKIYYASMGVAAYRTAPLETTILLASGLGAIIVITLLLSLSIKKISPKNLMEE